LPRFCGTAWPDRPAARPSRQTNKSKTDRPTVGLFYRVYNPINSNGLLLSWYKMEKLPKIYLGGFVKTKIHLLSQQTVE
ncbi:MAG TPA: hypothetical protein VKN76_06485, partial [Kiloniellaceae bacterium]|nr:hypothetical protein [Kiloniellaceae bacterium]